MPLYEYKCRECGGTFEQIRRAQEATKDLACPKCNSSQIELIVSIPANTGCGGSPKSRFQ